MRTIISAIAGLAMTAGVAQAETVKYRCEFEGAKRRNIPEIVVISHDKGSGTIMVLDPFIKHYFGEAIAAELAVSNSKRDTFKWVVSSVSGNNLEAAGSIHIPKIIFRLTIQKSSLKASISSRIPNTDTNGSGSGQCEYVR